MNEKEVKYIIMKDGRKIKVDDTSYFISKNKELYVYVPTFEGAKYMPMGEVEKEVDE